MALSQRRWRLSCNRPVVRGHGGDGTPCGESRSGKGTRSEIVFRIAVEFFGLVVLAHPCAEFESSEVSRMHRFVISVRLSFLREHRSPDG